MSRTKKIKEGIPVCVDKGRVYHSNECNAQVHVIQDNLVKDAIQKLKEETFHIAIHPNISLEPTEELFYGGKPLVIPFDPAITYMRFPDHPHLNMGTNLKLLPGTNYSLPDTICYSSEPNSKLGNNQRDRLLYTFDEVTIWLFRHQVWVAKRELTEHGKWIGPHEGQLDPESFPSRLNPQCWLVVSKCVISSE